MRGRSLVLVVSLALAVLIGAAVYLVWAGDSAPSERARWGGASGILLLLLLLMGAASRRRRKGERERDRG